MSVVVARDQSTADKLVFLWPEALPWGAELVCSEDEVAVLCPNWAVGELLRPGRHTISPPSPAGHIMLYFVRTSPVSVPFDNIVGVFDRSAGKMVSVRYHGAVSIKAADPKLLCSQIIGVPSHDIAASVLRSAMLSVHKALHLMINKALTVTPSVAALATPAAASQLGHMASLANPMAIAVSGLEFVRFEELSLSVDSGPSIRASVDPSMAKAAASDATLRVSYDGKGKVAAHLPGNLPPGAHVLVYWSDGLWHAGTVRQFRDGRYEVAIDGMATATWVLADHVRPAA